MNDREQEPLVYILAYLKRVEDEIARIRFAVEVVVEQITGKKIPFNTRGGEKKR